MRTPDGGQCDVCLRNVRLSGNDCLFYLVPFIILPSYYFYTNLVNFYFVRDIYQNHKPASCGSQVQWNKDHTHTHTHARTHARTHTHTHRVTEAYPECWCEARICKWASTSQRTPPPLWPISQRSISVITHSSVPNAVGCSSVSLP